MEAFKKFIESTKTWQYTKLFKNIALNAKNAENISLGPVQNGTPIDTDAKTEKTTECLKEFEEILEQQLSRNTENADSLNKESDEFIALDDINDVIAKMTDDQNNESMHKPETSVENNKEPTNTVTMNDSDNDNSGYNSSDFEFITEDEAQISGLTYKQKQTSKLLENKRMNLADSLRNKKNVQHTTITDPRILRWSMYQKARRQLPFILDDSYKNNSKVLTGEEYRRLFDAHSYPHAMGFVGNKSIRPTSKMQVNKVIRFNPQTRNWIENEDDKKEAAQTIKKIIDMYPAENRKRRKRF